MTESSSVRTVFFGSGCFAVPILDALVGLPGVEVVAVVSAPDRPVGRKAVVTPTPVTARARELGLAVLQPVRVRRPEAVAEIEALHPDLAMLADYGQLIPRSLLDLPPRGFLNLHPSALPRHRGAAPIPATILAGDRRSAVTLMAMVEEMDAGPIVAVSPLEVSATDTAETLEERAAGVAAGLLTRALPEWLAGKLSPQPQPEDVVTLTRPLRREDARLDPTRPAAELERQIRAYQPWPGAYLETEQGRLIVWSATVVDRSRADDARAPDRPAHRPDEPGRLVRLQDGRLALTTSTGPLALEEVQLPGGRRMTSEELLRGHPELAS